MKLRNMLKTKDVQFGFDRAHVFIVDCDFVLRAINARRLCREFVVFPMDRLLRSHHETSQYVGTLISLSSAKIISKSERCSIGLRPSTCFYG